LSPQGASIFIYGHENGVTLVWRGGRRLKPSKPAPSAAAKDKQNGSSDDSVMIIDSDDDEAPASKADQQAIKFEDKPQFEAEAEHASFPEIVQTLDLTLGTAVLNVAVMPLTPRSAGAAAEGKMPLLGERLVFAVSCVTNDVYVITLPLTPPSPESKARPELRSDLLAGRAGSGAWGETLVLLGGQTKPSEGIAMGLILPSASERAQKPPRAVVASHSREASGTLRLWDVPLDRLARPEKALEAFQTEFLPAPLSSVRFNPTHTTQLLAVSSPHGVRIYDFALPSLPPDSEAIGPFPSQGSWLLTLYQPFSRPSSTRKPVLDAAWICHGRAVFALMADGMWGIWDIDGVNVAPSEPSISARLKSGVQGAALTSFSVSGYAEGTSFLRSGGSQQKEPQSGEFAPMTPHTRRQATAGLGSQFTLDRLSSIQGGIKVMALPATGQAVSDESVALWVGGQDNVCAIPAVLRFWESQRRKAGGGGVFGGAQSARMVRLTDLSTGLLGERCCGVSLLPGAASREHSTNDGNLPVDVLVQGESRLVVVREGDEGPGKKIGGVVTTRKRLFSKNAQSEAIIVHGKQAKPANVSFNLSIAKPGTLRGKPPALDGDEAAMDALSEAAPATQRSGFDFMDTLSAAADVTEDMSRDVDLEMLDLMGIDKALKTMEGGPQGAK
jgi:hypothetical protein